MSKLPSRDLLSGLLNYDAQTGVLTWRESSWADERGRPRSRRFGGETAGHKRSDGKVVVSVEGRLHLAHRLIWKLVHGEEPDCVDHINGDPSDNRLANLRNGTQADNNRNVARRSDNASGVAGVSYRADRGVWRAYIQGKTIGSFKTKGEAIEARIAAQAEAGFTARHGQ